MAIIRTVHDTMGFGDRVCGQASLLHQCLQSRQADRLAVHLEVTPQGVLGRCATALAALGDNGGGIPGSQCLGDVDQADDIRQPAQLYWPGNVPWLR